MSWECSERQNGTTINPRKLSRIKFMKIKFMKIVREHTRFATSVAIVSKYVSML